MFFFNFALHIYFIWIYLNVTLGTHFNKNSLKLMEGFIKSHTRHRCISDHEKQCIVERCLLCFLSLLQQITTNWVAYYNANYHPVQEVRSLTWVWNKGISRVVDLSGRSKGECISLPPSPSRGRSHSLASKSAVAGWVLLILPSLCVPLALFRTLVIRPTWIIQTRLPTWRSAG